MELEGKGECDGEVEGDVEVEGECDLVVGLAPVQGGGGVSPVPVIAGIEVQR